MNPDYIYGLQDGRLSKRLVRKIHTNWTEQHANKEYVRGYIAGLGYAITWNGSKYVA